MRCGNGFRTEISWWQNWQNHGAGHDTAGKVHELIEFNSQGTIVWTWDKPTLVSSLQGVLILDSLNTNLIYDDRNGTMSPLNSPSSIRRASSPFNNQILPADQVRVKNPNIKFGQGLFLILSIF